jgi:hypothetical protein
MVGTRGRYGNVRELPPAGTRPEDRLFTKIFGASSCAESALEAP